MTAAVVFEPAPRHSPQIAVHSDPLGNFAIAADEAIEFPQGILGFPGCHRFALVRAGTESMYWLQSLDYGTLVFLLVDPFVHFAEYSVDVTPADRDKLRTTDAADIALLAIVTLPPPGTSALPTVNLQGPIAINLRTRTGKQIVCAGVEHGVRRVLTLSALVS